MSLLNGKEPPTIQVAWLAEQQTVGLGFDRAEFKNWGFVVACLRMAVAAAEKQERLAMAAQMQHAAQQEAEANELARKLRGS